MVYSCKLLVTIKARLLAVLVASLDDEAPLDEVPQMQLVFARLLGAFLRLSLHRKQSVGLHLLKFEFPHFLSDLLF